MRGFKYRSKKLTHEKVKKIFLDLLNEKKTIDEITVSELAKKSGITRGTFYIHYKNAFDVAKEIEQELILALESSTSQMISAEDFTIYLHQVFVFLEVNKDFYQKIFSSDSSLDFVSNLDRQINQTIQKTLNNRLAKNPTANLDVAFFVDGMMHMILKYFRGEISFSLSEIEWYLRQKAEKILF